MSKKILIIEDELPIAQIMVDSLKTEGYEVEMANDGEMGLQKAKSFQPDLILLDIMLPKMDGRQMLKELQSSGINPNCKIIVLTNVDADMKTISDVVASGGHDYLVKANTSIETIISRIKERLS